MALSHNRMVLSLEPDIKNGPGAGLPFLVYVGKREREREGERERQTDRQTERQTERERERET